jgi:glyoxylase-like metal-dependent hydrolase (beta-lactamase superfamily II)
MGDTVCWIPDVGVLFAGDVVENRCGVYAGDAYVQDWCQTLEVVRQLGPRVMVPGRGAYLASAQACTEAIDLTRSFLQTLLDTVGQSLAQGESLGQCFERAKAVMTPLFGDWPVFQHVLPFDVARVFDELSGIEHPRVWTAERDQELWAICAGPSTQTARPS